MIKNSKDSKDSCPPSSRMRGTTADCEPEGSRVLEGEVISVPARRKSARSKFTANLNSLKKLKLSCGLGCLSFIIPITLAIIYKNGLLVMLAFLLPLWFFSRK
ncbi:MAG: hypothetical protein ABIH35_02555 [Patescibacteria group bacterium]